MKIIDRVITETEGSRIRIYPIGDLHITLRSFQTPRFRAYLRTILDDPNGIAFLMGDLTDARVRDHRYFDPEMIHPRYRLEDVDDIDNLAADELSDYLAPLVASGKLRDFLRGNHYRKGFSHTFRRLLALKAGIDMEQIEDLGNRAVARIKVMRPDGRIWYTLLIFLTHVDSGSRKPGAQANRQHDNQTNYPDVDLFLYAHSHRASGQGIKTMTLARNGKLRAIFRRPLHINAGAFVDSMVIGADSYADAKNLPPLDDVVRFAEYRMKSVTREQGGPQYKEVRGKIIEWDG